LIVGSHASQFKEHEKEASMDMQKKIMKDALGSLFGIYPDIFDQADKFVKALASSDEFKGSKISLTGQSLGGAITSYVSLRQQIPGIALNSFPLGPSLQDKIDPINLQNADEVLRHIISQGDIFADCCKIIEVLDVALKSIGFTTPHNFGKKMHVDTIYDGKLDSHYYILGSLYAKSFPSDLELCKKMASRNVDESKKASSELSKKIADKFKAVL
jgi:hypothetical protein